MWHFRSTKAENENLPSETAASRNNISEKAIISSILESISFLVIPRMVPFMYIFSLPLNSGWNPVPTSSILDRNKLRDFLKFGDKNEVIYFVEEYINDLGNNAMKSNMFRQYLVMDTYFCVVDFVVDLQFSKDESSAFPSRFLSKAAK